MSFMMKIDAARLSPLDMLVADYLRAPSREPSLDFCCRVVGVPDSDEVVARRLHVSISTVRSWREIGRRAEKWTCR
jgi:hypothetical protein